MKNKPSNLLSSVFGSSKVLQHCAKKLEILDELNTLVQNALNPELKAHCKVANLKKNTLILSTTSPVWKYQLHFWQYEILQAIHTDEKYQHIKTIKTKIDKHEPNKLDRHAAKIDLKHPSISLENAEILKDVADGISSEKLANALKKISKHAIKSKKKKNNQEIYKL